MRDKEDQLRENLWANCVSDEIFDMDKSNYAEFMTRSRELMVGKIRAYYESL